MSIYRLINPNNGKIITIESDLLDHAQMIAAKRPDNYRHFYARYYKLFDVREKVNNKKKYRLINPNGEITVEEAVSFDAARYQAAGRKSNINRFKSSDYVLAKKKSKNMPRKIKKSVSKGSKARVNSKSKRKNLYDWAWKQKGKGSLKRIGAKMKSLSKTKGLGSKVAIRQLGMIGDLKAAFNKGVQSVKRR